MTRGPSVAPLAEDTATKVNEALRRGLVKAEIETSSSSETSP